MDKINYDELLNPLIKTARESGAMKMLNHLSKYLPIEVIKEAMIDHAAIAAKEI